MKECKHRRTLKIARRMNLNLSGGDTPDVQVAWYCAHPFHGLVINIGETETAMQEHCAQCSLAGTL